MNKSHFRQGLSDLSQTLDTITPSKNSKEKVIKQAKAQLIALFMNENTKFNTNADVNQAFDYFLKLTQTKQNNIKHYDSELARKWEEIIDELSDMHKTYNNPNTRTSNDVIKKSMTLLHHRIKDIEAPQTTTTAKQNTPQQTASQATPTKPAVKPIETIEIITSLEKLIKETEQEIKNPAQNEYFKKHAKTLQGKNIWIDGQAYTVSHLNKNGTLELKHKDQPKKISLSSFVELKKLGQVNGFADNNQEKDKQNGGLKAMRGLKKHEEENHKFLQSLFAGEKAYLDELTQRVQQQKLQVKLLKENEKTQGNNLPTVIPANGENLPAVVPNKTPDSAEDPDTENSENLPAVTSPKILLKRPKKMIRTNYPAPDTAETPDTENLPAVIPANGENLPAVIPATGEHLPAVIPANGENLPAIIEDTDRKEKAESGVPGLTETTETTSKELLDLFTLDAHVMDKHKLIKEAERNRIREESDRAYESANRLKKMKMFIRDRYQQHRKLKSSLKTAQEEHNFIEQGDVQQRIDGNIGTYASQDKMNIESRTVEKVDLGSDDKINSIAHQYLMGEISKEEAIAQFNATFKTIYENNTNDIQALGSMTGTDIMAQLENPATKRDYIITHIIANTVTGLSDTLEETTLTAIKDQLRTQHHEEVSDAEILDQFEQLKVNALKAKLSTLKDANLQIKVKLRGLMKDSDSAEVEGVNYKHLDKGMIALFSKFTNQFGLAGNITAKIITGAIITASR